MASIVVSGDTSGTVTLQAPAVAGTTTLTLPATSGTLITTGGGAAGSFTTLTSTGASSFATSSGNVGIGTNSPREKLEVSGAIIATSGLSALQASNASLDFSSGSARFIGTGADASTYAPLIFGNATTTTFAERMRITSAGRVGIGTSSPSYLLSLQGTTADVSTSFTDTTYATCAIGFNGSGSTNGVGAPTQTMYIGNYNSYPTVFTVGNTERMRIDSSGRLLVGCTSEPNSAINGFKAGGDYTIICGTDQIPFYVNRNTTTGVIQQLRYNNSNVGNISTTGSNCTFNSTSDYRLKENIAPMTGALTKVQQLKPVTYKWKKDGQVGEGFIAHELQEVCPEAVTGTKDEIDNEGKPVYQAIDQSVLVATLTAAIQELNAKVEAQAAEIAALKGAK